MPKSSHAKKFKKLREYDSVPKSLRAKKFKICKFLRTYKSYVTVRTKNIRHAEQAGPFEGSRAPGTVEIYRQFLL
ncbi:MAG: hypothetical protein KA436_03460 [Oligoflexales bacterium]|nr:hypothetical protein [Oligoflexales bacterium]